MLKLVSIVIVRLFKRNVDTDCSHFGPSRGYASKPRLYKSLLIILIISAIAVKIKELRYNRTEKQKKL